MADEVTREHIIATRYGLSVEAVRGAAPDLVTMLADQCGADRILALFAAHRDAEVEALRGQGAHLTHCNQNEHVGVCKYGADECPMLTERWAWLAERFQKEDARYSERVALRDQVRALTEENTAWRERADEIAVKVGQLRAQLAALTEENAELEEEVAELRQWALPKYRDEKSALKLKIATAERERDEARASLRLIGSVAGSPRWRGLEAARDLLDAIAAECTATLSPTKAPSDG